MNIMQAEMYSCHSSPIATYSCMATSLAFVEAVHASKIMPKLHGTVPINTAGWTGAM